MASLPREAASLRGSQFHRHCHTPASPHSFLSYSLDFRRTSCKGPLATSYGPQASHNITDKMDPYSSEGELINIHAAFHQYQYQSVLDDFDPSSFSTENHLPARVLQLRARVALGQGTEVLSEVSGAKEPELVAVGALAELSLGKEDAAAASLEKLLADGGDAVAENAIVQVIGGTVLASVGKADEALQLLGRHQGNREFSCQ